MPKAIDITGLRFGYLIAIRKHDVTTAKQTRWLCVCDCGNECVAQLGTLRSGQTKSCGCLKSKLLRRHGETGTRTHDAWRSMWGRCLYTEAYRDRTPPDRWKSYENFKSDMGECPEGCTLERIKNHLPYSKGNCRWATKAEQNRNQTKTVRVLMKDGRVVCMAEAARELGINYQTVKTRVHAGWSLEAALNYQAESAEL